MKEDRIKVEQKKTGRLNFRRNRWRESSWKMEKDGTKVEQIKKSSTKFWENKLNRRLIKGEEIDK